jgi:predicted nucleic-acid-binding protein
VIAIDTNVLLRYLLADDTGQYRRARKLIESKSPALLTDVVLVEAVWTLMGKRYGFDKAQICVVIRTLIGDQGFAFEDSQVIKGMIFAMSALTSPNR